MQVFIHIGLPLCGASRIQSTLDDKRDQLIGKGVLYPRAPGRKNHTRLFMAVSEPNHIDPLRWNRGYGSAATQAELSEKLTRELASEITAAKPDKLILSAVQLSASLSQTSELERLHTLLAPFADEFRIIAHVDEQARLLARFYAEQVMEGRTDSLEQELAIDPKTNWRRAALDHWGSIDPMLNDMPEIQAPPFWLDYSALVDSWEQVFGKNSVSLRPFDGELFSKPDLTREICAAFELPANIGKALAGKTELEPAAPWLSRNRAMNQMFRQTLDAGRIIPRQMWRRMLGQLEIPGDPIDPGSLGQISARFADENKTLLKKHKGLTAACLRANTISDDWVEAAPEFGFRASQYMTVFLPMIDKVTIEEQQRKKAVIAALADRTHSTTAQGDAPAATLSPILPPLAIANYNKLVGGRFAPHNNTGRVNEEELAAQYTPVPKRKLPKGNSGNVVVGCMKNEAPYIIEWIAYHLAIGVDNFLIYTNGCEDGTSELLDRLQEIGVLQHRNNDDWRGNSPQQFALNQSLKEPLIENAEWIIHIDVDEFINVRTGNGTLADFIEQVPDATNIAMTWRLFGHNGVTRFLDKPVIEQFDTCAPKYCPKPHTVWGFKTMFKNIGAYEKISCHRPNKLKNGKRDKVQWVNGSGMPMGEDIKDKGWRSEMKSVGYDLIQLNHYALRSAESFLIKRQRGRALHVDRTIGLNYWVRMDWSDHRDVTIQRNLSRLQSNIAVLMGDEKLANLHEKGVDWHRAKVKDLHDIPEFKELFGQALNTNLTEMERVAYSLALDMES